MLSQTKKITLVEHLNVLFGTPGLYVNSTRLSSSLKKVSYPEFEP